MLLHYDQIDPFPSTLGNGWVLENGKFRPIPECYTALALPKRLKDAVDNQDVFPAQSDSEVSDTDGDSDDLDEDI